MASWLSKLFPRKPQTDHAGFMAFAEGIEDGAIPDPAHLARLEQHLPPVLIGMLRSHGFAHFSERRFQFCDPEPFADMMNRLFADDPDFGTQHPQLVGFTCFGEAQIWAGDLFSATLDFNQMTLRGMALASDENPLPAGLKTRPLSTDPDIRARSLLPFEPEEIDFWDPFNTAIFRATTQAFGPLEQGDVFAFDPPLAANGGIHPRRPLERLSRISAVQAFEAAASSAPLRLVRTVRGEEVEVRTIGRA